MKSTLSIMAIATILFILCNNVVCANEIVTIVNPDTGETSTVVIIK